jgi:hypothetical protein
MSSGDLAILYIYDPIYKKNVLQKEMLITDETEYLLFSFKPKDTIALEPKKYLWDIKIYKNPTYVEGEENTLIVTDAEEIHSYYSAFSLPVCEIREAPNTYVCARQQTRDRLLGYNIATIPKPDDIPDPYRDAEIIYGVLREFPEIGDTNKLYFDLEEKILYYWDGEYIPVNAMLIANTVLEGGEA